MVFCTGGAGPTQHCLFFGHTGRVKVRPDDVIPASFPSKPPEELQPHDDTAQAAGRHRNAGRAGYAKPLTWITITQTSGCLHWFRDLWRGAKPAFRSIRSAAHFAAFALNSLANCETVARFSGVFSGLERQAALEIARDQHKAVCENGMKKGQGPWQMN